MSHVRSLFWIPHLRRLSKSVIRNCYGCKKFRSLPYHSPEPGPLPRDRTERCFPFEVIDTEEIDYPILTRNSLILGRNVSFPDAAPHESKSETIKKRHKYIRRCKEALWKRWKHEYLVALREKHNLKNKDKPFKINVGDVVLIKGEEKNRGHWKIGIVNHLYNGKDNIIRVAQLRIGKKLIDRPI